jgi:myo-inositol-1(or 4)-monophosphatase
MSKSNTQLYNIDYQAILNVAKSAALKAAEVIKESRNNKDLNIEFKDRTNLVTQYDLAAEKVIIEEIKKYFPDHDLLTEETNTTVSDNEIYQKPLWIVDPIDGTTNFVHGHYQVSTSIGFSVGGQMRVGVVYNPFLDEMFEAIQGQGAYRNGKKISCNKTDKLNDALFVTGFPYKKDGIDIILARIKAVLTNARELRRLGSGALDICWVADGRMDVYYESLSPWDCAAGIVIAREAGVICGHIDELPSNLKIPSDFYCEGLLFANPSLFKKAQELLRV